MGEDRKMPLVSERQSQRGREAGGQACRSFWPEGQPRDPGLKVWAQHPGSCPSREGPRLHTVSGSSACRRGSAKKRKTEWRAWCLVPSEQKAQDWGWRSGCGLGSAPWRRAATA